MSKQQDSALEVWLDDDLGPPCLVGTLAHDRGQIRFHYERDWLKDPRAFALDPGLPGRAPLLSEAGTGQLRDLPGLIA